MNKEQLQSELDAFDKQISDANDQIRKLENDIHWLKKRKKLVTQQMQDADQAASAADDLKEITGNLG